jgi:dTMP kinase
VPGGRLITIEGVDGAGKTTLAAALADALRERGEDAELLREPGGVAVAERIRALVKDPSLTIGDRAEALLFAAARAQLVEERIAPALGAGRTVVLDRFLDSSLAYQGGGRGLGVEAVRVVNALATGGLVPDRTLLLVVPPETGRARQGGRDQAPDRMEREDQAFFRRVADTYWALAEAEPNRIFALDASLPPGDVLAAALAVV